MAAFTDQDSVPLVLDLGSSMLRLGQAGDDHPRVPAYPNQVVPTVNDNNNEINLAARRQHNSPMGPGGQVENWDALEQSLRRLFANEFRTDPATGILVSEPVMQSRRQRDRIMEIMFESFSVPRLMTHTDALLAIYSSGHTSCFSVDIGETKMSALPVAEGYFDVPSSSCSEQQQLPPLRQDFGGRDLTQYVMQRFEGGKSQLLSSNFEAARDFKEKKSETNLDNIDDFALFDANCNAFDAASNSPDSCSPRMSLPDGSSVAVDSTIGRTAEILFNPGKMVGRTDILPIQDFVAGIWKACDISNRKHLMQNIVLCGASTQMNGFRDRLELELQRLLPGSVHDTSKNVRVVARPDRTFACWIGGSIVGSLSMTEKLWMARSEWFETGSLR